VNDYELLYLIVCDQDGIALEFLINKYDKLIWKYIHNAGIKVSDHEDFHQIALEILLKAIYLFNEVFNKSFTRYFQLILQRDLWRLQKRYYTQLSKIIYIEYDLIDEKPSLNYMSINEEIELEYIYSTVKENLKTILEKQIYEYYFVLGYSVIDIAKKFILKDKQVYNAVTRLINKMRNTMKK